MPDSRFNFQQVASRIEPLLSETVRLSKLNVTFEARDTAGLYERAFENPDMVVAFTGPDADLLLENKAELLKAIEHVVLESVDLSGDERERILFDCQEYRMMRVDELQLAARAAADKVRRTGVIYKFSPMNSRERRMIHMALRGESGGRTEREGLGSYRQVVIHPTQGGAASPHHSRAHRPSR